MKKLKYLLCAAIISCSSFTVFAKDVATETKPEVLTVAAATKKAIAHSATIENLGYTAEQNEENLEDLYDSIRYGQTSVEVIRSAVQYMQITLKMKENETVTDVEKQKLEFSASKLFYSILSAEKELELYKKSLALDDKSLKISEVKAKLGLLTNVELESQTKDFNKKQTEIVSKQTDIDTAYQSLNSTMGEAPTKKYELELSYSYTPLEGVDLAAYIKKCTEKNSNIISKTNDVAVAEYQLKNYASELGDSRKNYEIKATQARRALDDAKANFATNLTNCYNTIMSQEISYDNNLKDLDYMQKQLLILQTKYKLGKATALDIEKSELQITELKETIDNQVFEHFSKVQQFNNPELL